MVKVRHAAVAATLVLLTGCLAPGGTVKAPAPEAAPAFSLKSLLPLGRDAALAPDTSPIPPMHWDHLPAAEDWTREALTAISARDDVFANRVPGDIARWCPAYETASVEDRRAFWAGMFSTLAKHESTWNPRAAGGGGKWIGLTQIDPRSARYYGCDTHSVEGLKDPQANLRCAVQIASVQMPKDNMVSGPRGRKGLGRDWGPFRSERKREDMRAWISQQEYCQPGDGSPVIVSAKNGG